jgi:hypothetical protein
MWSLLEIPEIAGFAVGILIGIGLGFAGGVCVTLALMAVI